MSQPATQKFVLQCECGLAHAVETRHAGETRKCACGKELEVPTLREIRKLPPADSGAARAEPRPWTPLQGAFFAVGLPLVLIAVCAGSYLAWQRSQLDTARPAVEDIRLTDFDQLTPTQVWDIVWLRFRDFQLNQRQTPEYLLMRQRSNQLLRRLFISGGVGLVGVALVITALLLRPKS